MNERKKGIVLSYVYMIVSIFVTFLYTPFLISNLGKSEYGLFTLASSIIAYLSLLDLGLGNAMVRYVSKYKTLNKNVEESQINGMFLILYIIIGVISILIGSLIIMNSNLIFSKSLTPTELNITKILLIILVLNISINFPLSVFGSYVIASEKFFFQKMLLIIKTILTPIIMIPLLLLGFKSISLVIVLSVLTLLINLSNMYLSLKKLDMRISISFKCFKYLNEIFSYSFFIFLAMIVDSIFNNTDQILLGIYSGTTAISIYAVSSQIRSLYEQLSTSISGVFLPKVVNMVESGKTKKQISDFFLSISRVQMIILFLILFGFVILGKSFISIWTDPSFVDAYYISLIIIVPASIPLTQNIALSIIQAENKHQFRAVLYFIIAIINIVVSIPLINLYSGIGAAIGTSVALFIGHIFIMNIYYYKKINIDIISYWKNFVKILVPIAIYSGLFYLALNNVNVNSWLSLFIFGVFYTLGYFIIIYVIFMNEEEKKYLKNIIKFFLRIVYKIYPRFLIRRIIIFESSPDMTGNTYEIYQKLLSKKVNLKYKFVWYVSNKKNYSNINEKNVVFVSTSSKKNIFDFIRKVYYNFNAKIIIDSNNYVHKCNKHQIRFHLFHGMGFKKVTEYNKQCGEADYFITSCKYFSELLQPLYYNNLDKFHDLGMARNDVLVKKTYKDIHKIFNIPNEEKIIVWLPTYRNHKSAKSYYHFTEKKDNEILVINDLDEINRLNEYLVKNNIVILLKLHPAEDTLFLKKAGASNIILITDDDLLKNNINLYEILSRSDSLITDYSSVYFDYLLTDKPIGLTLNDLDSFNNKFGFLCDNYEDVVYGEKIYNIDDFKKYIYHISKNKYNKEKYLYYKKLYNTFDDSKSTERLYKLIKKHL